MYLPREEADEVLLLAVLHIEHHVPELLREARPDRERFLGIADANSCQRLRLSMVAATRRNTGSRALTYGLPPDSGAFRAISRPEGARGVDQEESLDTVSSFHTWLVAYEEGCVQSGVMGAAPTYDHSTSPGPCIISRICSSVICIGGFAMAGAVYVIKDKGWAAMERGGCGSGERRRNATVTMITAARLTRAPLGRLAHVAALSSVTPPLNYRVTSNHYGGRRGNSVRLL